MGCGHVGFAVAAAVALSLPVSAQQPGSSSQQETEAEAASRRAAESLVYLQTARGMCGYRLPAHQIAEMDDRVNSMSPAAQQLLRRAYNEGLRMRRRYNLAPEECDRLLLDAARDVQEGRYPPATTNMPPR